jgi:hypothetical protein
MKSRTTARYWKCYERLPAGIRVQAKEAYKRFLTNPYHPSLHFKRVHSTRPVYAVRITKDYRALGLQREDRMIWFWIGSHSHYEKLVERLRKA